VVGEKNVQQLVGRFIEAVEDVLIPDEAKAEVVINLAKAWGVDDEPLRQCVRRSLGEEAADHPYFFWKPNPRFTVGQRIRVVDGAPQVVGHTGRIDTVDNPRKHGARGMSKGCYYSVILDGGRDPWGFREEQLEPWDDD